MTSIHHQRGIAILAMTVIVMLIVTIASITLNRQAIVEIKTSGNHYLSAQSFEAAQAGVDEAIAKLNDTTTIGTFCGTASTTFKKGCVKDSNADGTIDSYTNTGTNDSQTISGVSKTYYSYTVTNPTSGNTSRLRISSTGCSDGCNPCNSSCTSKSNVVQEVYVMGGTFGAINSWGNVSVQGNTTVAGNIISGKSVSVSGSATQTSGAQYTNFSDLSAFSESSPGFKDYYLGASNAALIPTYSATLSMQKPSASDFNAITLNNTRSAIINLTNSSIEITGGSWTIGSASSPVVIIASADFHLTSQVNIYGIVYAARDYQVGAGGSSVTGMIIAGREVNTAGNGTFTYDQSVIDKLLDSSKTGAPVTYARILGTWRDF